MKIIQKGEIKNDKLVNLNWSQNNGKLTNDSQTIMQNFDEMFAKTEFFIGMIKGYEATIKLKENEYISRKPDI